MTGAQRSREKGLKNRSPIKKTAWGEKNSERNSENRNARDTPDGTKGKEVERAAGGHPRARKDLILRQETQEKRMN